MSSLASYQSVFRVAKQDGSNGSGTRAVRRNRPMVSCTSCRARKLKCDRQQPCGSCAKRDDGDGCNFSQTKTTVQRKAPKTSEAQARLQKLEEMVAGLIGAGSEKSPGSYETPPAGHAVAIGEMWDPSSVPRPDSPSSGRKIPADSVYAGPTHWTKILEDIRDIQGVLDEDDGGDEEEEAFVYADGPSVVIEDQGQSLSVLDLCGCLPSKDIVDGLVSDYISKTHSAVLHTKKFAREYEAFWADNSSASLLWLSILFSVCYVGACAHQNTHPTNQPADGPPAAVYLKRAGQALQAGKFHRGRPLTVEALLMYGIAKHVQKKDDPDTDAWLVMGLSVRMAMRMGYHRDPRHHRHLTPFQAEMRRRVFHTVATFDLLLSYQMGMPAILHEEQIDCELPGNLLDSDFDEDSPAPPIPRPETEATPMLYFVTKFRQTRILRRIMRHALAAAAQPYARTLELDAELRACHAAIPPSLRMQPTDAWGVEPVGTLLNRVNLEILYLKNLCVLHRPYLTRARADPALAYSRNTCVDAALRVLRHQADLDAACAPGGRLYAHRWVVTGLTMHDFLLAAMVVCLDLADRPRGDGAAAGDGARGLAALRESHRIWTERRGVSREARRASDVLGIMLAKLQEQGGTQGSDLGGGYVLPLDQLLKEPHEVDWDQLDRCLLWEPEGDEGYAFGLEWGVLDQMVAQDGVHGGGMDDMDVADGGAHP